MVKNLENGIARISPEVYKGLLAKLLRTYKYFNHNEAPEKVIIPRVDEIDGVPVEMEDYEKVCDVTEIVKVEELPEEEESYAVSSG